jgi:hypothetical protein
MSRSFFILAMAGILMQNFGKFLILVNFELNRAYITKNLCVKKEDPNNCCKGKCYLKKQIEQEEKKEESPSTSLKDKEEIQYCQNLEHLRFLRNTSSEVKTPYQSFISEGIDQVIYRPPKV